MNSLKKPPVSEKSSDMYKELKAEYYMTLITPIRYYRSKIIKPLTVLCSPSTNIGGVDKQKL